MESPLGFKLPLAGKGGTFISDASSLARGWVMIHHACCIWSLLCAACVEEGGLDKASPICVSIGRHAFQIFHLFCPQLRRLTMWLKKPTSKMMYIIILKVSDINYDILFAEAVFPYAMKPSGWFSPHCNLMWYNPVYWTLPCFHTECTNPFFLDRISLHFYYSVCQPRNVLCVRPVKHTHQQVTTRHVV